MKNEAIKMIKTPLSVARAATFSLFLALATSCGSEQGAPTGSTITVNPNKKDWTVGSPPIVCDNSVLQSSFFDIVVKNPNGTPQIGVDIRVSLDLTPGTFIIPPPPPGGLPVMFLFDTSDGVTYNVPITNFPYFTTTGNAGVKTLRVQYDLTGCTYAGNLDVHSGSSFGSANISVKEGT